MPTLIVPTYLNQKSLLKPSELEVSSQILSSAADSSLSTMVTVTTRYIKDGEPGPSIDDEQPLRLRDDDRDLTAWVSPVVEGMTFTVIDAKHRYFAAKWKESPTYHSCYSALKDTVMRQEKLNITACMSLGLGTFTGNDTNNNNDDERRDNSLMQLVAFECLIDQLKTRFAIAHVYFQDPAFSTLDQELLRSKGYEILHTPESDDYMSEMTFLFTPAIEMHVEESSLAAAYPALWITHKLQLNGKRHAPPEGPLVDRLLQSQEAVQAAEVGGRRKLFNSYLSQCVGISLPDSAWDRWFHRMRIYYKPDSDAEVSPAELELVGKRYTYKQSQKLWRRKGYIKADDICPCCGEKQGELSPDSSDTEDAPSPKLSQTPRISQDSLRDIATRALSEEATIPSPISPPALDAFPEEGTRQGTAPTS